MNLDRSELSALTRIFSSAVFQEIGRRGQSSLFSRLVQQSRIASESSKSTTVGDAFDRAFYLLRTSGNRDDYIYRSAITQKILLGRHSLRTASVLYEARAGSCKADVVVFNGTSTAYEIKSERDSLARLENQLDNYRVVFAEVNVVTSASHLRGVLAAAPDDVGVLLLTPRFTIQKMREAENRPGRTQPLMILDSLRSSEAVAILRALGIDPPVVPNTRLRGALRSIFASLDPASVHDQMVATLKRTRSQSTIAELVEVAPPSLRTAILATRMSSAARSRFKSAIRTPLNVALAWK